MRQYIWNFRDAGDTLKEKYESLFMKIDGARRDIGGINFIVGAAVMGLFEASTSHSYKEEMPVEGLLDIGLKYPGGLRCLKRQYGRNELVIFGIKDNAVIHIENCDMDDPHDKLYIWDYEDALGDTIMEKYESFFQVLVKIHNALGGLHTIIGNEEIMSLPETATAGFRPVTKLMGRNPIHIGTMRYHDDRFQCIRDRNMPRDEVYCVGGKGTATIKLKNFIQEKK